MRPIRAGMLGLAFALVCWAHAPRAHAGSRALELETRLWAPCCYAQTLDIHESELATSLRHEIDQRLAAGEDPRQIEDALVQRFGERIRAVPRGAADPREQIPRSVGVVMGIALFGLAWFGWRLSRRAKPALSAESHMNARYDAAIDQELSKLE